MKKVVIITNIPNPYRIPLFNALSKKLYDAGIELIIIFGATGYDYRKWKNHLASCNFTYQILGKRGLTFGSKEKITFFYPGLLKQLKLLAPDLVITNAFSPATLKLALNWITNINLPYLIWSGAIQGENHKVGVIRKILRKFLVKHSQGGIAYGDMAKQYLVNLGMNKKDVAIARNSVDTDFFVSDVSRTIFDKNKLFNIITVSYLNPGKRIDLIIRIASTLIANGIALKLTIVGDGSERETLEKLAIELSIDQQVIFLGNLDKVEVLSELTKADAFVFASEYDIWGLAVVEAMATSIPCIVSNKVGVAKDLIIDKKTGFIANFDNPNSVVDILSWVSKNQIDSINIGIAGRKMVIDHASLNGMSESFLNTIRHYV